MKHTLFTLMLLFLIPVIVSSQDLDAISPDRDISTDGRDDCVTTIFSIPVPYLRSDCPESNQADINITYRFKDCFGLILGSFCDFSHSVIELNGASIKTIDYGGVTTTYNETISSNEFAHLITESDEACFTIKVYKECTLTGISEIYSATQCVSVLKEGDQFSKIRVDGPMRQETLECQQDKSITVCSKDPAITITTEVGVEISSSQSNSLSFTYGDVTTAGQILDIGFPTTYNSTTNLTTSWSEGTSIVRHLTITPEDGVCKSAALNLNLLKEYTDFYSIGDCDEEIQPYLSQVTGEVLFNVTFHECVNFICPQEKPLLALSRKIPKHNLRTDCVGSIEAIIPPTYSGELEFSWTGPNGFLSNNQNLDDVSFGAYTLIVIDYCNNEYEYSFFLCDDIGYGDWEKSVMDLIFCRSLVCDTEDCEIEDSQECVEPDEIIEAFENGSCIEKYFYNGDFLGEVSSVPEIKIEYDQSTQQCIKIAKCKNEEYLIEQNSPTFGLWEFNYSIEECYRSVYCFDEIISGINDTKDPEIEET